jgi:hypothetical protein
MPLSQSFLSTNFQALGRSSDKISRSLILVDHFSTNYPMEYIQRGWKLYNTKNIRYWNLVPASFQLMQVLLKRAYDG